MDIYVSSYVYQPIIVSRICGLILTTEFLDTLHIKGKNCVWNKIVSLATSDGYFLNLEMYSRPTDIEV